MVHSLRPRLAPSVLPFIARSRFIPWLYSISSLRRRLERGRLSPALAHPSPSSPRVRPPGFARHPVSLRQTVRPRPSGPRTPSHPRPRARQPVAWGGVCHAASSAAGWAGHRSCQPPCRRQARKSGSRRQDRTERVARPWAWFPSGLSASQRWHTKQIVPVASRGETLGSQRATS